MLFSRFLKLTGNEPSTKQIMDNFKTDLRRIILNSLFLIYRKVYKVLKTVLSNVTKFVMLNKAVFFSFRRRDVVQM